LLSTKLALQNKHFSAQNALKLIYRHVGFQNIFPGITPRTPFGRERGKEGRGRGRAPIILLAQGHPTCKSGLEYVTLKRESTA